MRLFPTSTLLIVAWLMSPACCFGHSLGRGANAGPTPPLKAYFEELRRLSEELPNGAIGVRGVLDQFKLWPVNAPISVCFNGGESLRDTFVQTSLLWTSGTSLSFDFGNSPNYRSCKSEDKSNVRVSFIADGNWSYIGTDSLQYSGTTLNVEYDATTPDDSVKLAEFRGVILHELGHAIGFEHEHQSPESKCEEEFDWPRVYTFAASHWGWSKSEVDFNMRVLVSSERLRITSYDRQSIMHYYFEPELFKQGKASRCFVGHNMMLSQTDRDMVRDAYSPNVALQDDHLQQRATAVSASLASLNLTTPQLSSVGQKLGRVLAAAPRKIILDFDLARASGRTLTRGPGEFQVCAQQLQPPENANVTVACEVAKDASALLVAVEPR